MEVSWVIGIKEKIINEGGDEKDKESGFRLNQITLKKVWRSNALTSSF